MTHDKPTMQIRHRLGPLAPPESPFLLKSSCFLNGWTALPRKRLMILMLHDQAAGSVVIAERASLNSAPLSRSRYLSSMFARRFKCCM